MIEIRKQVSYFASHPFTLKKMKLLLGTMSKCGCLHAMVITMMFTSSWHPLIEPAPCPRPVVAGAEGVLLSWGRPRVITNL